MRYRVRARFREEMRAEFLDILTDGTVEGMKPFGREVADAMRRAVWRGGREEREGAPDSAGSAEARLLPGVVEWTETCYCPTPLLQERAAVYDRFFEGIETEEIPPNREDPALAGERFWEWLEGNVSG